MAGPLPKCPKCDNPFFVLQQYTPAEAPHIKIEILLCSMCGAVVGTTGRYQTLELIGDIRRRVEDTYDRFQDIEDDWLKEIRDRVRAIFDKLGL